MTDFSNTDDIIDVRDIIEKIEELRESRDQFEDDSSDWKRNLEVITDELSILEGLMSDLEGVGGDEKWEGIWYPVTLIRDSHFKDYAQDLAEEIGAVNPNVTWPNNCIDWEQAARELRMDYSSVEFDNVTYWTR